MESPDSINWVITTGKFNVQEFNSKRYLFMQKQGTEWDILVEEIADVVDVDVEEHDDVLTASNICLKTTVLNAVYDAKHV